MKTLQKTHKVWIALIVMFMMILTSPVATAGEQQNAPEQANLFTTFSNDKAVTQAVSNTDTSMIGQFIAFFDAIKFKLQHVFDVSIAPKIIAIINTIESQCKNLVQLVTGPPTPADAEKVNAIANNIDAQRKSLWSLILSSTDQNQNQDPNATTNAYLSNLNGTNKKENSFQVYAH